MAVDFAGALAPVGYCTACGWVGPCEVGGSLCCGAPIDIGYACPICGSFHADERAAIDCCGWDQTPDGARTARQRLEEAGQLALEV